MTYQAYILLRQLKKVQKKEDGAIWVDEPDRKITTVVTFNDPAKSINLSKKWGSFYPTLNYLREQNLVEKIGSCHYSLTYSGYHYIQTAISSVLSFLFRSVLVPVAVSIITTLIVLKLFGITEVTLTLPIG